MTDTADRMPRPAQWLPLLVLLLLAACAAPGLPGGGACGLQPRAEMPVRIVQGIPMVAAQVNGAPVSMVLDSGAERTVLTEQAARRVGLEFDPRNIQRGAGAGGAVQSFAARVRRFEVAGLAIPDHPVLAIPHAIGVPGGEPIDGLLPALVLSAFDVDLDMPGRKVTLYGGTVCGDTAIPSWQEAAVSLPADFSSPPRVLLRVRAGPAQLRALLDTGAQGITITRAAALAAGIPPAELDSGPVIMVRGVGPQPVPARLARLPELLIGPEAGRNVRVIVTDSGMHGFDMILGMDYLGARRLWLSYARQQAFVMVQPRR